MALACYHYGTGRDCGCLPHAFSQPIWLCNNAPPDPPTGTVHLSRTAPNCWVGTDVIGGDTISSQVSGIIGVPPGYVGYEQGGRLINELNADPYSVFLLDEAEKAHPNVWKPFLNLFDEGWIVDQRGVKAQADRAIFLLTTNAGDRNIAQMTRNGCAAAEIAEHVKQTLLRAFGIWSMSETINRRLVAIRPDSKSSALPAECPPNSSVSQFMALATHQQRSLGGHTRLKGTLRNCQACLFLLREFDAREVNVGLSFM